jgi:hypothetical protein
VLFSIRKTGLRQSHAPNCGPIREEKRQSFYAFYEKYNLSGPLIPLSRAFAPPGRSDGESSLEAAPFLRRGVRLGRLCSVVCPSQHSREPDKDNGHGKAHNQRIRRHQDLL